MDDLSAACAIETPEHTASRSALKSSDAVDLSSFVSAAPLSTAADTLQGRPSHLESGTGDAALTKFAARWNARKTPAAEIERWFREHAALSLKEVEGTLTEEEALHLNYVRWNLNRIEDARVGPQLDKLEEAIDRYEGFLAEIRGFTADLDRRANTRHR